VLGCAAEGYIVFRNAFSYLQFLSNTELCSFYHPLEDFREVKKKKKKTHPKNNIFSLHLIPNIQSSLSDT